jgi:epoxyqueuosine reductase QueG
MDSIREASDEVRRKARMLGCDLCGFAPIERFENLPSQTNPRSLLPGARSVILVAKKFLTSTASATSTIPYTIIRNMLSHRIDSITVDLSYYLEGKGYAAVPTGAIEPCNYNKELDKSMGLVSLKNAAYQAGLGVIGKNTLLLTPQYGNMVWLGAVVSSIELEYDVIQEYSPCKEGCRICIDSCPVHAIDGSLFMDQKRCWEYAFGSEDGGEWRIKCNRCRVGCPFSRGYKVAGSRTTVLG